MENLNIEHHHKRLIMKALDKKDTIQGAADALGIHVRKLHRLRCQYGIEYKKSPKKSQWVDI